MRSTADFSFTTSLVMGGLVCWFLSRGSWRQWLTNESSRMVMNAAMSQDCLGWALRPCSKSAEISCISNHIS